MADQEIRELTAETALQSATQFIVQDSTDRATRAPFSLVGGLENETSRDTNADHADFTASIGTIHTVDMSSLASGLQITLPSSANVGESVAVYVSDGSATQAITFRNSVSATINSVDYNASDYPETLTATGDLIVFRCVSASGPKWAQMHRGIYRDAENVFTAHQRMSELTDTSLAGAVTFDFAGGDCYLDLTENITSITASNIPDGATVNLFLQQGATARTVTGWPSDWHFAANTPPDMATTDNAILWLSVHRRGAIYLVSYSNDLRNA